ncbi:sensor domain-containing diguanylate cyclase (plasmid) [Rhizobium rosettiformans]|uniref:diguanylate cyclase n=1 Tax=Rhizobium rosettiformans TaxID=1368430 RepID=A0ABX7F2Z1_9HYPH|nr:sensor domain-containing diguanylate cyclase [Rhizobium rosettiformans]
MRAGGAVVGICVFVTALAGIELTRGTERIAAIWISNAVLLAAVLKEERSSWIFLFPAAWLGNILANLQSGDGLLTAATLSAVNMIEVLICALLVTGLTKERDFRRPRPMFILTAVSMGPACLLSAGIAAFALYQMTGASFISVFANWYAADALGLITVTPLLLILNRGDLADLFHRRVLLRTLFVLVVLVTALAAVFLQSTLPLLFLAFPAIILATFCLGFPGAAFSVFLTAMIGLWSTMYGLGPIALIQESLRIKLYALQLFTATSSITSFAIACLLGERTLLMSALSQAPDFHYIKNLRSEIVSANLNVARHVGLRTTTEVLGKTDFDFTNRERAKELFIEEQGVMFSNNPVNNKVERVLDARGNERWFETSKVPLHSATGRVVGMAGVTRDIMERRSLELELKAGKERLDLILSEMSGGLAVINSDGFIIFCNEKYKSLFPLTGELRNPGAYLPSILALSKEKGEAPGLDPKIAMRKLKEGADDELELYNGTWLRIRSNPVANGNTTIVVSDVTDMKKAYFELRGMAKKLELLADTDGLTGLFNRRSFDERIEQEISRCRRNRKPISLIMIDVDRFKAYNDHYGHQAGDAYLQNVARVLEATIKRPADFVARYGGEEMCIVLPETEQSGAFVFAEHVRLAVNRLAIAHAKSEKMHVTISAGVAALVHDGKASTAAELIYRADTALYTAKSGGRDRIACWNGSGDGMLRRM